MFPKIPEHGINPTLAECRNYVATMNLAFIDGKLHQLHMPANHEHPECNEPVWKPVDSYETQQETQQEIPL